ncbi:Mobile element protein [Salinisphaera sp. LB1]|nr:Mobile element protein [Salinisphaera sp. LB1]
MFIRADRPETDGCRILQASGVTRMNTHKNARLTVHGRDLLVRRILQHGQRPVEAAQAMGVSARTAYKWLARYREHGQSGLYERSSRPARCPHRLSEATRQRIVALRRERRIYRAISRELGVPVTTIARVLQRADLNRLSALDPAPPVKRYTREAPGDLLHLDIKKLGRFERPGHRVTGNRQAGRSRGAGWDHVHVAIDDHSRVSHATIWPDETGPSAVRALIAALRYYRHLGVRFDRVLTDNGGCYKSAVFAKACRRLGLKHKRTRPYRPRTNGKAERLIQTALHEWAYARAYDNADQRAAHLPHWLHDYNWHRPHASLDYHTPISTLGLNNLVALHT